MCAHMHRSVLCLIAQNHTLLLSYACFSKNRSNLVWSANHDVNQCLPPVQHCAVKYGYYTLSCFSFFQHVLICHWALLHHNWCCALASALFESQQKFSFFYIYERNEVDEERARKNNINSVVVISHCALLWCSCVSDAKVVLLYHRRHGKTVEPNVSTAGLLLMFDGLDCSHTAGCTISH